MTAAGFKAIAVLISFSAIFIAERFWPADFRASGLGRVGRNLSLAFVNFLLGPILILPITAYAAAHGLGLRPQWWNVGLDLLVLDLWIYGWHRVNHVVPFLWRFHEIHHRDEMLDTTSALRFHFGEVVLSAIVRSGVIWLLAIPFSSALIFETVVVIATIFHHSNLRLPTPMEDLMSRFIVTPKLHWVHHHAQRLDTDSNYATVLSIWDKLFSSRSPNLRTAKMKLGVEGGHDLTLPQLLLKPFEKPST